jgi:WD40 repeat protein
VCSLAFAARARAQGAAKPPAARTTPAARNSAKPATKALPTTAKPSTAATPVAGAPSPAVQPPAAPLIVKPNRPLGAITALAFSPDGRKLAVGTYGEVVLYDTTSWQPTGEYRKVTDSVRALAFRPDGQALAIGCGEPGRSGITLIWDTISADGAKALARQADTVEALAFDHDGKELLVGANDNKARFYPSVGAGDGSLLDAHNGRVQAVAFSPHEGTVFVTGAMDRIVKVWDQQKVQNVINFDQSEGGITGLVFLSNGVQFVGSSTDGRLYWWGYNYDAKKQTYNGYHFRTVMAHPDGVYALSGTPDCRHLITGGADSEVNVWNADNGGREREFKDSTQPIYAVALTPDGKTAVGGGREGMVLVWDVGANKLLAGFAPPALPAPASAKPAAHAVKSSSHVAHRRG